MNEQPRNQWHEQLLKQAERPPIADKFWDLEPASNPYAVERETVEVYDWPEGEDK